MVPCDWNPLSGSRDGMPSWIPHIPKPPQHCAFCLFERFKCPFKHFQHSDIHQTTSLVSNMSFRYDDEALRSPQAFVFWKMPLVDAGNTICEAELQATVLNYGQGIFEGLKAQEVKG